MEDQTYQQFIENIITSRGRHGCGEAYHEQHHIVPKCVGGSNNAENLVDLYAHEHFIAHKLLAQENPHNSKLQFAWWCMSHMKNSQQERYVCTPQEYEEVRIAFSEAISGSGNPFYGCHHTDETRAKMRKKHITCSGENHYLYGKHMPESTKQKLRDIMSGPNSPNYGRHYVMKEETKEKLREIHLGMKASEETKKKMSEAHKGEKNYAYGKKRSLETRRKISEHHADVSGAKNPRSKPVRCIETGEEFWGAKEAQDKLGICKGTIAKCCKGKGKTAGGYHWEYIDDNEEVEEVNEED